MENMSQWLGPLAEVGKDYDVGLIRYMLALGAGGLIVVLFALNRFGATPIGESYGPPISTFPTRILASSDELARAMTVYVTTMIGVLVAISVLGPAALKIGGFSVPEQYVPVLPLVIALILVGAIAKVGYLDQIELQLGQFARERAYIPAATLAIADRMAAADFDFAPYQDGSILTLPSMAGVEQGDFSRPRGSLEYSWARLCALSYELDAGRSVAVVGVLGNPVLRALEDNRQILARDVVEYRAQLQQGRSYSAAPLHARIREALRAYHILLAGGVRRELEPGADVTLALVRLGFLCPESHEPVPERGNLMIGGLGVMWICVLVLVMIAAALSSMWNASAYFPTTALDAVLWSVSAVSAHGVAILLADRARTRALARGRWYRTDARGRSSPLANLIRVGVRCGIGGYVVLVLWGATYQQTLTPALFKGMAAYAMMPATTGAFYAWALDNIELGCRPARWLEIGRQAIVTAFFGLLACSAWLTVVGADARSGYDLIIMTTLFGAVIGGALGWYIPASVQQEPYDPLGKVRAERVRKLEELAQAKFGYPGATQWLDTACAKLGNRTPRGAAGEGVDGYDDAAGLLARA